MEEFYKLKDQKKREKVLKKAFAKNFFEAHPFAGTHLIKISDLGRQYIRTTAVRFLILLEEIRQNPASGDELTKNLPQLTDIELLEALAAGETFLRKEMAFILDFIYSVEEYPGMFECIYLFYVKFKNNDIVDRN